MTKSSITNIIYNNSPSWLQDIFISLYGYKLYKQRYTGAYKTHLDLLNKYDKMSLDDLYKIQNDEFIKLVMHAKKFSPFYNQLYKNISLEEINSVYDIWKLPIIDKETIRNNIDDLYTINPYNAIKSFTGGTTGTSLIVLYKQIDMQKRMAILSHFEKEHGVELKSRRATFNGRQLINNRIKKKKFWRYNFLRKQKLYSTFDLNDNNISYYIEDLNKFKPEVINGFVSAIYELAKYINTNKIELKFNPKCIFTTSESLLEIHRSEIEMAFSCKVRNQYASSEGAPFITECKCGNLHFDITSGIIEEIDGEMIITSFTTYGTPLIRYRIGDMVSFNKNGKKCNCGSVLPIVDSIEGRKVDFLYNEKMEKVSLSHLADVIKGFPNCIKNTQFIQKNYGEIIINVVLDKKTYRPDYDRMIMDEMIYRFGSNMKFSINKLNEIPRSPSGKYQFIINKLR
jgi:phenylacetate-CoA ligase